MKTDIFKQCQKLFPAWAGLSFSDFEFDDPKGFSSFTMGIRSKVPTDPSAVLYRQLDNKENAVLDYETEKKIFLLLGDHDIAAHCHYYDRACRIESFYQGRTLLARDLFEPDHLKQIANQLHRFHQLSPTCLPQQGFFELMFDKWGKLARHVLEENSSKFPDNERQMCEELRQIYQPETRAKLMQCLPQGDLTFCHNDTYHGNIMKLDSGEIKLLDFEFSCLNHKTYDFSNLFAETVMQHQQAEYPYFKIAEPEYGDRELGILINAYLDNDKFDTAETRNESFRNLLQETKQMLRLSDFKYAMASLPLALNPIQKIRFIPYAYQRFNKFLDACA